MSRTISEKDLIKSSHVVRARETERVERKLVTAAVKLYMEENVL